MTLHDHDTRSEPTPDEQSAGPRILPPRLQPEYGSRYIAEHGSFPAGYWIH